MRDCPLAGKARQAGRRALAEERVEHRGRDIRVCRQFARLQQIGDLPGRDAGGT